MISQNAVSAGDRLLHRLSAITIFVQLYRSFSPTYVTVKYRTTPGKTAKSEWKLWSLSLKFANCGSHELTKIVQLKESRGHSLLNPRFFHVTYQLDNLIMELGSRLKSIIDIQLLHYLKIQVRPNLLARKTLLPDSQTVIMRLVRRTVNGLVRRIG